MWHTPDGTTENPATTRICQLSAWLVATFMFSCFGIHISESGMQAREFLDKILISKIEIKFFHNGTEAEIQLLLKRFPDSSISSLILAGWCEEGHPTTKNLSNNCLKVTKFGCLPYAVGKHLPIPLINLGGTWRLNWWWRWLVLSEIIVSISVTILSQRSSWLGCFHSNSRFWCFSPCLCNVNGSLGIQCDNLSGQCQCKPNAMGKICDSCKQGTFNLVGTNPDGCQPCFCFGHGNQCTSAGGYQELIISSVK